MKANKILLTGPFKTVWGMHLMSSEHTFPDGGTGSNERGIGPIVRLASHCFSVESASPLLTRLDEVWPWLPCWAQVCPRMAGRHQRPPPQHPVEIIDESKSLLPPLTFSWHRFKEYNRNFTPFAKICVVKLTEDALQGTSLVNSELESHLTTSIDSRFPESSCLLCWWNWTHFTTYYRIYPNLTKFTWASSMGYLFSLKATFMK